ncbi:E3 ubiquitin-protein ligase RGLG1 [Hibiscus syriacus]|uniref:E3 ubiquitin-protein ligase RGLG1 n=1 Tax=Hibiscus syriacus TaxID=106335 RepID=A0A6A2WKS5_HIBSY|nr:E3 ubiquitin-protein ligase RGLG1 [Hibiscus syriacus]
MLHLPRAITDRKHPAAGIRLKYTRIDDNYKTLDQVTAALAQAGLESSNLIVGIDFTKSNEWTGARSFNRKILHHIGNGQNPYEQAISIIGQSLSAFDEDNLIPCYGFGDGPTSFAPIIEMAMTIVEQSGGQYHVLLIIADGQVTRSVDTQHGQLSPQEQKTIDAIVTASEFPLSIVLVGIGDGPWDMMREFDDNIPARAFDNLQFVNFTEIMSKNTDPSRKQAEFALSALMEIPSQYKATIELGLLRGRKGNTSERVPLPPPMYGASSFNNPKSYSRSSSFQQDASPYSQSSSFKQNASPYSRPNSFQQNVPPYAGYDSAATTGTGPSYDTAATTGTGPFLSSLYDNQVCPICLSNPKDMAFGCGHQIAETSIRCPKAMEALLVPPNEHLSSSNLTAEFSSSGFLLKSTGFFWVSTSYMMAPAAANSHVNGSNSNPPFALCTE